MKGKRNSTCTVQRALPLSLNEVLMVFQTSQPINERKTARAIYWPAVTLTALPPHPPLPPFNRGFD